MADMNFVELERIRGPLEELSLRKQLPQRQQADKPILKYDTTLTRPVQLFSQPDTLPCRDTHSHSQTIPSTGPASTAAVQHGSILRGLSHQGSACHRSGTGHTSSKLHKSFHLGLPNHRSSHHGSPHQSSSHNGPPHHGSSHHGSTKGQNQLRMASSVSSLSSPTVGAGNPYNRPVSAKEAREKTQQNRHQRQRRLQSHSGQGAHAHSTLSRRTVAVLQDAGTAPLQLNTFLRPQSGLAHHNSLTAKPSPPQQRKEQNEVHEETCKGMASLQSAKATLQQVFALASTASAAASPAVTGLPPRPKDSTANSPAVTGLPPRPKDTNPAFSSTAVTGLPPRPKDTPNTATGLSPYARDSPSTQGRDDRSNTPSRRTPVSTVRNPYYSPNKPYTDVSNLEADRRQHTPTDPSKLHSGQPYSMLTPPVETTTLLEKLALNSDTTNPFYNLSQEASSCKAGMEESGAPFLHTTTASALLNTKFGTLRKMPVTNTLTGTLYYKKSFREATRLVEQKQKKGISTDVTAMLEHRPVGDGAPSSRMSSLSAEEKAASTRSGTATTEARDESEEEDVSTPSGERLPGDGEASTEDLDDYDDNDDGINNIYEDSEVDSSDVDSDDYTISSSLSQQSFASAELLHISLLPYSSGRLLTTTQTISSSRMAGAGEEGTHSFVCPLTTPFTGETQPALRQSLFPAVPPTINFVPEGEKVEQLPWEIRKLLKWRMSPITPNIVKAALGRINFRITKKSSDWLGCFGKHMKANAFKALREYQKLNHFPGSFQLGRKDRLWRNLSRMQISFGKKEFGFFPKTYVLPQDLKQLKRAWEDSGPRQKWIVKPPASARGIGIKVISRWSQVPRRRPVIVQKYLSKPLLINGSKFDMRVYVYVTSYDPLRAYVFEDGLARFASCKYSSSMKNLSNKFMHLTNYSINKRNTDYQSNTDETVCQGHKWSLKALWNFLKKHDVNTQAVWDNIKDIVVKTLISAEGSINSMVKSNVRSRYIVHELFGFDILLDDMMRPWILEVNISPSLHSNSQLDINVKGQMIKDMMNLAGFRIPDKNDVHPLHSSTSAVDLSAQVPSNDYCMDKRLFTNQLTPDERAKHAYFCHRHQDEQVLQTILDTLTPDDVRMLTESIDEDSRKGGFIRVFPTPSTRRYLRFMEQPRYYNLLLDQWVTRYNRMEQRGITLLQGLCEEGLHLENPTENPTHQWFPPNTSVMMPARDKTTSPLKKESPLHIKSSPSLVRLPKMREGGNASSLSLLSPSSLSLARPLDLSR